MTKKILIVAVVAVALMSAARFDGAVTKENGATVVSEDFHSQEQS